MSSQSCTIPCPRWQGAIDKERERVRTREAAVSELGGKLSERDERITDLESKLSWRPIQDAPKDGTAVLGFMPAYYQGKGGQHVIVWMNFSDRPGWYSHISGMHEPTHWMPLPEPPK